MKDCDSFGQGSNPVNTQKINLRVCEVLYKKVSQNAPEDEAVESLAFQARGSGFNTRREYYERKDIKTFQ